MTKATEWGQLKKEIDKAGMDTSNMVANVRENHTTLHHLEAALPEGPFTIYLLAQKQKGGEGSSLGEFVDQIITGLEKRIEALEASIKAQPKAVAQIVESVKEAKVTETKPAKVKPAVIDIEDLKAQAKAAGVTIKCKTGKKEKSYAKDFQKAFDKAMEGKSIKPAIPATAPPVKETKSSKTIKTAEPDVVEEEMTAQEKRDLENFQKGLY